MRRRGGEWARQHELPAPPGTYAFHGYLIRGTLQGDWEVSRDGFHITWAKTEAEAKQAVLDLD